jgi:hypothetical protein
MSNGGLGMDQQERNEHEGKAHKKAPSPIVYSSEFSKWLRGNERVTHVNNYKKSGGIKQK